MKKFILFLFLLMLFPMQSFAKTCGQVVPDFNFRGYIDGSGELVESPNYFSTSPFYNNLSNLYLSNFSGGADAFYIFSYDNNYNFLGRKGISTSGDINISLNSSYYYRFTFNRVKLGVDFPNSVRLTTCPDNTFGGMLSNLTIGSSTFFSSISQIIPFVISLIAFALGFLFLKKMIKRGNQGHA